MISYPAGPWKAKFAWVPVTTRDEGRVWLRWYWRRLEVIDPRWGGAPDRRIARQVSRPWDLAWEVEPETPPSPAAVFIAFALVAAIFAAALVALGA